MGGMEGRDRDVYVNGVLDRWQAIWRLGICADCQEEGKPPEDQEVRQVDGRLYCVRHNLQEMGRRIDRHEAAELARLDRVHAKAEG